MDIKKQITQIFIKWHLPTRQVALNDLEALFIQLIEEAKEEGREEILKTLNG